MFSWYFNPFVKIAGTKALVTGLVIIAITTLLGYINGIHFDGVLDVHIGIQSPLILFFCEIIVSWFSISLVFYLAGLVLSKSSIRIIDVAGTQALARYPMLCASLLGFVPYFQDMPINSLVMMVYGIIMLIFLIWYITLMFNAYKVSCNLKGNSLIISFVAGIIIAEVLSKGSISLIYSFLIT